MKKAAFILYLIGGIFAIIGGASFITVGAMGQGNMFPADILNQIIKTLEIKPADLNTLWTVCFILGGISLGMGLLGFGAMVYTLKSNKKGFHILMLVLTVLIHFDILYLIAEILGIADGGKSEKASE